MRKTKPSVLPISFKRHELDLMNFILNESAKEHIAYSEWMKRILHNEKNEIEKSRNQSCTNEACEQSIRREDVGINMSYNPLDDDIL